MLRWEQHIAGEPTTKRRKYRDCAQRLLSRVEQYTDGIDKVRYLRGVAHNISY